MWSTEKWNNFDFNQFKTSFFGILKNQYLNQQVFLNFKEAL